MLEIQQKITTEIRHGYLIGNLTEDIVGYLVAHMAKCLAIYPNRFLNGYPGGYPAKYPAGFPARRPARYVGRYLARYVV